jgi:hypothetical protein
VGEYEPRSKVNRECYVIRILLGVEVLSRGKAIAAHETSWLEG